MTKSILLATLLLSNTSAFAANTHIVYIGDSHSVGTFGEEMDAWIRKKQDTDFTFFASGGTAPFQWLHGTAPVVCWLKDNQFNASAPEHGVCLTEEEKSQRKAGTLKTEFTPKFETLLKKDGYEKKVAIIAHGTNFGTKGNKTQTPEQQFNEQVNTTVSLIELTARYGYQCFWVGPPRMRKYEGVQLDTKFSIIKTAIEKAQKAAESNEEKLAKTENRSPRKIESLCTLIDSRPLTQYPASTRLDGIHYTFPGASNAESIKTSKEWAQKVTLQLP